MGFYVNPKNRGFWESIRSKIYVDKTGLIACTNEYINTEQKFICVSRPRRFGKSMALKMLAAYYSRGCDSADLFAGLQIEREETYRQHLNQYDVIWLNMQQFLIEAAPGKVTDRGGNARAQKRIWRAFRLSGQGACRGAAGNICGDGQAVYFSD